MIIGLELLTFGRLFSAYAIVRAGNLEMFNASQATLDIRSGALNTLLLITGSWCVARAVPALHDDRQATGARWPLAAVACAIAFLVSKWLEFAGKFAAGFDLTTNTFYRFYYALATFGIGEAGLTGAHATWPVLVIFALAWTRGLWIALDFMELRSAPALWRRMVVGGLFIVVAVILLAWTHAR